MKRICKGMAAVCLLLCLLAGSALASEISGVDAALAGYWTQEGTVRFSLSAQLDTYLPYVEETVSMMNNLLKHMSVEAELGPQSNVLSLAVAGDSVVSLTETQAADGTQLTTPLLPNRTLHSAGSMLDALSADDSQPAFDAFQAVAQAQSCYQELTDAILPYAEEKKANYKIKNVGSSKWSRIARLSKEQSAELSSQIIAVLSCGMDDAYRRQLQELSFGKGFIVGLYQSAQGGDDMAVYMKGNVTLPEVGTRALSFQWAFSENGSRRIDTWKFELGKGKKGGREVAVTLTREAGDSFLLKGDSSVVVRGQETNTTYTQRYDLSGQAGSLTGSAVFTQKQTDQAAVETRFTPNLTLTQAEGSGVLSGQVSLSRKAGKNTTLAYTLLFSDEPAQALASAVENGTLYAVDDAPSVEVTAPQSSLTQNEEQPASSSQYLVGTAPLGMQTYTPPTAMQAVDWDSAAQEQRDALMGEMAQNLAGRLLIALSKLPQEDVSLLKDNMSEENFTAFLQLIDAL